VQQWFAYIICDDSGDDLGAYLDQDERDAAFAADLAAAGGSDAVETYSLGIVEGETLETALNAVRLDDWVSFTQAV
jgi:hypothetical protein